MTSTVRKVLPLTRILVWGQELLSEILSGGDSVVDLTAGTGQDVLFLRRKVGSRGRVLAFDIQQEALQKTARLLEAEGVSHKVLQQGEAVPEREGVWLVQDCHSRLGHYVRRPIRAIVANLGYLPGGSRDLITLPQSTLLALEQGCDLLEPGGRMAVVVYPGHPGGKEEGCAVEAFFAGLEVRHWEVIRLEVPNAPKAPRLYAAEKKGGRK